eukprot:15447894-Alexandrium_andersonii.AAC.1
MRGRKAATEQAVTPPLVRTAGRVDVAFSCGGAPPPPRCRRGELRHCQCQGDRPPKGGRRACAPHGRTPRARPLRGL